MAYRSAVDPDFWPAFHALPETTRRAAEEKKRLFEGDNAHPSLQFKLLCRRYGLDLYSARVDRSTRVLGYPIAIGGQDAIKWFWIGPHPEYDRLVKQYCG